MKLKSGFLKELDALASGSGGLCQLKDRQSGIDGLVESSVGDLEGGKYNEPKPHLVDRADAFKTLALFGADLWISRLWKVVHCIKSPIEELFAYGAIAAALQDGGTIRVGQEERGGRFDFAEFSDGHEWDSSFDLVCQPEVVGLHPDFILRAAIPFYMPGGTPVRRTASVAIELDGHDFHERTKEQATRDKKRDRKIAAAGFVVLRFTGSEIHRNPITSAAGVLVHVRHAALRPAYDEHFRAAGPEELERFRQMHPGLSGSLEHDTGWNVGEWAQRLGSGFGGKAP